MQHGLIGKKCRYTLDNVVRECVVVDMHPESSVTMRGVKTVTWVFLLLGNDGILFDATHRQISVL